MGEGIITQCAPTRVVQARSSDASLLRPVSTERSQVKGTVKGDAGATASLSSVRQVNVPAATQVKGSVKGDAGATASLSSVRQVNVPAPIKNGG